MKLEPYLLLDGVELANSLRTLTYLRRGLAGPNFEVGVDLEAGAGPATITVVGDVYVDAYDDIYAGSYETTYDEFWAGQLRCYCRTADTGPYVDPATDAAPWYDAARPESADFLGMIVDVSLLPVVKRSVTQRVGGGGSVGSASFSPRLVQVQGVMYAASSAAMAYGERWLARVLTGSSGCGDDVLTVLPACAPDEVEDDDGYLRQLVGVGIVDGPLHSPVDVGVAECTAQLVSFQLVSGDPYLRSTTAVRAATPLSAVAAECVTITAPALAADAALLLTIRSGVSEMTGVVVSAEIDGETTSFEIVDMPALSTLVIDAGRRFVTLTDSSGAAIGGLDVVDFDGIFPWMVAAPGQSMEVCIDATAGTFAGSATAQIDEVDREL